MTTVSSKIHQLFTENNWTWLIAGKLQVPTVDDIKKTLDGMQKHLYDEPVDTQMELGRLIAQRNQDGSIAVYTYLEDYDGSKQNS